MPTIKDRLASTGVPIEAWEELARKQGTTLAEAERKAQVTAKQIECTGERVSVVQAAAIVGRQPVQIRRWIRMGAVHVYSRTGLKGPGAETIVDLGSVRSAAAALDGAGTHAVKRALRDTTVPLERQVLAATA